MAEGGRGRGGGSRASWRDRRPWLMRAAILAGLGAAFHVLIFPPFGWTWLAWLAPLPVLLMLPAPERRPRPLVAAGFRHARGRSAWSRRG